MQTEIEINMAENAGTPPAWSVSFPRPRNVSRERRALWTIYTLDALMPKASTLPHPGPHPAESAAPPRAFAMLSHRGRVRQSNEDASGAVVERGVFIVCDGMGGAAAGEVASHLAVEAFLDSLTVPRRIPPKPASSQYPANHPHTRLEEAVRAANQAVYRHSQKSRALRGMGTTLVALLLEDETIHRVHVGDSRGYLYRSGVLHQLTQDHSLVEEQIQAGVLSRVEADSSPIRNIITRAIGSLPTVEPEIAAHHIQPGDLYLLASDGLTRELEDAEIASLLTRTSLDTSGLEAACQALIDAANAKGGGDNITVLLVAIHKGT
jgi:PPM family protein phosphatase